MKERTILGYTFTSDTDLSRQLGKFSTYVSTYKSKGLSYEEIIEKATKSKTVLGFTFRSDVDLSMQLGKACTYVSTYKGKGLSYEEIIEKAKCSKTVSGYTFKTDIDLSMQLGKNKNYVANLKNLGLSYEDIIERAKGSVRGKYGFSLNVVSGYIFKSDAELSRQLGKYGNYVSYYRSRGLSYEEIIKKAKE